MTDISTLAAEASRLLNYYQSAETVINQKLTEVLNHDVTPAKVIQAFFDGLTVSSVTYNSDSTISGVNYSSGNKQVISYSDGNVSNIKYYDTNGTTLMRTQTFTYNSDGNIISVTWS